MRHQASLGRMREKTPTLPVLACPLRPVGPLRPFPPLRNGGFTLLEILAAVFIFVLVIGTIWGTLNSTMMAYHLGQQNMDNYQNARTSMENFCREMRRAVSPNSKWTNNMKPVAEKIMADQQRSRQDGTFDRNDDPYANDPSINRDIRFLGTSKEVTFTLAETLVDTDRPFDLRKVRYFADPEKAELIRQTVQSIVELRREEWKANRTENETDYRASHDLTERSLEVGNGPSAEKVLGESIKDLALSYYSGAEWADEWDSDKLIEENPNQQRDQKDGQENWYSYDFVEGEKVGLPRAVRVTFTLTDGSEMMTITEVPSSAQNETPFDTVEDRSKQPKRDQPPRQRR